MKHHSELFQPIPLEQQDREPVRPVDSLSNYVIEELPTLLNEVRAGKLDISVIENRTERLAASQLLRVDFLANQNRENDLLIARIDILILQAAIVQSGGTPGTALAQLVDKVSALTNRPAGLTYEDVVIHNPESDIRTFSNGLMGRSEADFYNGHRYIEEALQPSVLDLTEILENENERTTEEIVSALRFVADSIQTTIAFTGTISKKMPVEHFRGGFRMYLGELPNRQLRGPSGAFTARVPLIEYLLMGETITDADYQYQLDELQYFPLAFQPVLVTALNNARNGESIRQMLIRRGSPEDGMKEIKDLSQIFRRFRDVHLKAVETHLPEVFSGDEKGTGGESDVVTFLKNRRDRDHGNDPKPQE